MDLFHSEAVCNVKHTTEISIKRLLAELESGGNVRFEEGRSSDVWLVIFIKGKVHHLY